MGKWSDCKFPVRISITLNTDKVAEIAAEAGIEDAEIEMNDDEMIITGKVDGRTYYDPGCMYHSNGDPGDPPEYDEEINFDDDKLVEDIIRTGGEIVGSVDVDIDREEPEYNDEPEE